MPSPEHLEQPQPFYAPHTDHGELAAQPTTSLRMEQVVTQLAASHNVDLSQKGATLHLDAPDQQQRWLIGNIDGERIGVTRCAIDENSQLAPDLDMVFEVKPEGWEPVEVVHTVHAWQDYAKSIPADTQDDFNFAALADTVAQELEQQESVPQHEKPPPFNKRSPAGTKE